MYIYFDVYLCIYVYNYNHHHHHHHGDIPLSYSINAYVSDSEIHA